MENKKPIVHVYTLSWNEELMMPFFIDHYSKFCSKIFVYDNESTDSTPEIVKKCPIAELKSWSSNNEFRDDLNLQIKHNAYKHSREIADWVIVCDADELVWHPNILDILNEYDIHGIDLPKIRGFNMIPKKMPEQYESLVTNHRYGCVDNNYSKRVIFKPKLNMTYDVGCHKCFIPPNAIESSKADLMLLHYKWLTLDYVIERYKKLNDRLSSVNKKMGWGFHYSRQKQQIKQEYLDFKNKSQDIISTILTKSN